MPNPLREIRLTIHRCELLRQLLIRNMAARYRGSVLGFAWSFAHPLTLLAVYTFVFGSIFRTRWGAGSLENNDAAFPLLMFCGMAVFNIFSEAVATSTDVVAGNTGYVKKVVFPLELLPLCSLLTAFIFGLAWFALLFVGTLAFLGQWSGTILLLPLTMLPLLLFSGGISFLTASLGVYLRDMRQFVGLATHVLFFMTPIFYPLAAVPERLRWVLQLNPLTVIVEQTRRICIYGLIPDWGELFAVSAVSLLVFALGAAWFMKTRKGFADVL